MQNRGWLLGYYLLVGWLITNISYQKLSMYFCNSLSQHGRQMLPLNDANPSMASLGSSFPASAHLEVSTLPLGFLEEIASGIDGYLHDGGEAP